MELAAALTGAMKTYELAKLAMEARDEGKAKAAISAMADRFHEMQGAALEASERAFTLQSKVEELSTQLREAQDRQAERQNYVLHEIVGGAFAYRFEPSAESGQQGRVPVHHLCQNCFDGGKKSVLRLVRYNMGPEWVCAIDGHHNIAA